MYGGLVTKRVTDDNGSVYWILFQSGELAHPEMVLADAAARAFAAIVTASDDDASAAERGR